MSATGGSTARALAVPVTARRIADRIVTAIALGEFVPGQRLPAERDLAAQLGVSRTTLRDALARVAALGMLDVRRGRTGGTFVRETWGSRSARAVRQILEPRWAALEQVMDMRHLVEALVARTAAERRTAADRRDIKAALRAYERADELRDAQEADVQLHHAVALATHNDELLALRERLVHRDQPRLRRRAVHPRDLRAGTAAAPRPRRGGCRRRRGQVAWRIGREHFTITDDALRATLERAVNAAR